MTRMSLVTREKILTDTQGKFCNALLVPFIQPVITADNISRRQLIYAIKSVKKHLRDFV